MKFVLATLALGLLVDTTNASIIHQQNFNSNANGWTYRDDTHYDTNNAAYADGEHKNGQLFVYAGGVNGAGKTHMSGGYEHSFSISVAGEVEIELDWTLVVHGSYENDEFGVAIVELDNTYVSLAKINGGGTQSGTATKVTFNNVAAGSHTVTLGVYNNKKTSTSEKTTVKYDNVKIEFNEGVTDLGYCVSKVLDFDGVDRGEYVSDDWKSSHGVGLTCKAHKSGDDGRCRVFDSSNPTQTWTNTDAQRVGETSAGTWSSCQSGDVDLGSPNEHCPGGGPGKSNDGSGGPNDQYPNCVAQGNILIVDERGPRCQPDDAVGGEMTFDFDFPVVMDKVCYIDMDGAEETYVDLYFSDGSSTKGIATVVAGDNGYACTDLSDFTDVTKLVFRMDGSGSVSELHYQLCGQTPPTTTTLPTTTTTTPATTTTSSNSFTDGSKVGGGGGDPHIQRWGKSHASFHGECDLVLVHSDLGAGLDLHVRSTIESYFSYFEMAALRVGEYTFEFDNKKLYVNGIEVGVDHLPLTLGEYTVSNHPVDMKKNPAFHQYYKVELPGGSQVLFKFYKQYLTINISGKRADFGDSVGLLGDYEYGDMLDRDGNVMQNFDALGFEWQVNLDDPKLFREQRAPQLPFEKCHMPTANRPSRRLLRGSDLTLMKQANEACANVSGSDFNLCVDDVMTTGDLGLAELW